MGRPKLNCLLLILRFTEAFLAFRMKRFTEAFLAFRMKSGQS
jgi:hypothetical protein